MKSAPKSAPTVREVCVNNIARVDYCVTSAMPSGRKKLTADDELLQCVKRALEDDDVIATLAGKIADIVANNINTYLLT